MTPATRNTILAARALIDTPDQWQKGEYSNEDNTCFCILGAFGRAAPDDDPYYHATGLLYADTEVRNAGGIVNFNDAAERTHDDIMALFDRILAS